MCAFLIAMTGCLMLSAYGAAEAMPGTNLTELESKIINAGDCRCEGKPVSGMG